MSSAALLVEIIPGHRESHSGIRRKTVRLPAGITIRLQPGIVFAFTPERFSRSPRNLVRLAPESALAGQRCDTLLATKVRNVPATDVQCDEIWGFVTKKKFHVHGGEENFSEIGDAWCFVAIERTTKLVLAHTLGKRTVSAATRFMRRLALATDPAQKFQLTTDGLAAYPLAVGNILGHQGERVDYAQLIKVFAMDVPEDARRYSPPRLAEAFPTPIYGDPDEKRICTSHVERQNLTMRMCMRRLTRLTNGFSKKWSNLKAALSLHFAYYNFCRRHMSLKGATPAMAAGLTDRIWTIAELLA